ncbi:FMN-binding negative transcriptional regulator [Flavisphingomonas formosensis]|uniref:FMN-binding negative transcriptional regulator n=1 Tax=Flavisphingomonas formosensis TaxID=861534 RepID=UPI001E349F15|nr:FMN-binding negative transcriptional regulator [Sphingomonas formosensis]
MTETRAAGDAPSPFDRFAASDVVDLIGEYPMAWITPRIADAGLPSLLPLLAETDGEGRLVALVGHMARRNPLHAALAADPRALILFTGPHGYVSPARVSDPDWGPTWNYAQLRIEADVRFVENGGDAALAQLLAAMERSEPTGWTTESLGARYRPMERAIIAFRAEAMRIEGRFKLGQDERPEMLRDILDRHPDAALTRWMRRFNADRV